MLTFDDVLITLFHARYKQKVRIKKCFILKGESGSISLYIEVE